MSNKYATRKNGDAARREAIARRRLSQIKRTPAVPLSDTARAIGLPVRRVQEGN